VYSLILERIIMKKVLFAAGLLIGSVFAEEEPQNLPDPYRNFPVQSEPSRLSALAWGVGAGAAVAGSQLVTNKRFPLSVVAKTFTAVVVGGGAALVSWLWQKRCENAYQAMLLEKGRALWPAGMQNEGDLMAAMYYYQKAADRGNLEAQTALFPCCAVLMSQDVRASVMKLREFVGELPEGDEPVENGDATAQYLFGMCLTLGRGVEKNLGLAARYLHAAADKGHALAQHTYGTCLRNGYGVTQNLQEADHYTQLAVDGGNPEALYNRGLSLLNNEPQKAVAYLRLAASKGDREAQFLCGLFYLRGVVDNTPNYEEGMRWMRLAANQGHQAAQYFVGATQGTCMRTPPDTALMSYILGGQIAGLQAAIGALQTQLTQQAQQIIALQANPAAPPPQDGGLDGGRGGGFA
jgi:TPR repeat protein